MLMRRNAYLRAMGIQLWQRRDKPSAAVSEPEAPLHVQPDSLTECTPPRRSVELAESIPSQVSETIQHTPPEEAKISVGDDLPDVTVAPAQTAVPEFRLASVLFPGVCIVLTEMDATGHTAPEQHQLDYISSVLFSLGIKALPTPVVTPFSWPMLRNAAFDQGEEAAKAACQAFLQGQAKKGPAQCMLLMGPVAGQYGISTADTAQVEKGHLYGTQQLPALVTEAIRAVFETPLLKRAVWQQLQPLRSWVAAQNWH